MRFFSAGFLCRNQWSHPRTSLH